MLPVVQDFLTADELQAAAMTDRWKDARSWGIVRRNDFMAALNIPVSPTRTVPNLPWSILEFPIVFDTERGEISIGAGSTKTGPNRVTGGVAYDVNGERIAIEEDATATIVANPDGNSPVFTGNIDIPLTLTGTTGGCAVNPSVLGTYYVWIEYAEDADSTYVDVAKDGTVHYPKILDGWRIRLTGTPIAPSGDGVSIFLAKVVWSVSFPGTLSTFDGEVSQEGNGNLLSTIPTAIAGEPKRVYSLIRDRQVEIQIDSTEDRTQKYANGMRLSLHEHINAVGSAEPTPNNPHGLTLNDIPGGTSEPKATILAQEGLSHGIVDRALSNNSPVIQTSAIQTNIENSTLQPSGLDANALIGTGVNSALQRAWVRVKALGPNQSVFVAGTRLKRLYPTLRNSDLSFDPSIDPNDPDSGDGWVGFSTAPGNIDPPGTYRIFGQLGNVGGTDVLLLRKVLLDDLTDTSPPLGLDEIEICLVYWGGVSDANLYFDQLKNDDKTTVEKRSAGLVGPGQISTDAKMHPNIGLLSREVFANLIGNSAFQFDKPNPSGQFPGWQSYISGPLLPNTNITQVTHTLDSTLVTGGPGALTGVKLDIVGGQTTGTTKLYAEIDRKLKPNAYYGISFWYKADSSAWNCRVRVGINANNTGSNASVITTGSPIGLPLDLLVVADNAWHRASFVVQTKNDGSVSPANDYYLEFRFDAPNPTEFPTGSAAVPFYLTNVQVTEGEWIPGYMGSHYVPSGAIILWDRTNTCPPGFEEITSASGKFLVGANAFVAPAASGGPNFNPSGSLLTSTNGTHTHDLTYTPDNAQNGVGESTVNTPTESAGGHSHSIAAALPYYGIKLCRAL
jgi:hypothetical protein